MVKKTYSRLCPLCRLVEGPPPHSWHLKGAPVMAWLDPEQRNSKIHLNIPRHSLPNIHWNIHSWFYTPGRVYDESCLQRRKSLYLERCSQLMHRHALALHSSDNVRVSLEKAFNHFNLSSLKVTYLALKIQGWSLWSKGGISCCWQGTVRPVPELHWFSSQDFGRQRLKFGSLCLVRCFLCGQMD